MAVTCNATQSGLECQQSAQQTTICTARKTTLKYDKNKGKINWSIEKSNAT